MIREFETSVCADRAYSIGNAGKAIIPAANPGYPFKLIESHAFPLETGAQVTATIGRVGLAFETARVNLRKKR